MTTTINASPTNGLVQTADGSGVLKVQSNGVTTNALAWVNFDGTATNPITPRSAYNVGSVTKNGTGLYVVNFTSALTDINYAALVSVSETSGGAVLIASTQSNASTTVTPTTSNLSIYVGTRAAGTATDCPYVNVAIFGN